MSLEEELAASMKVQATAKMKASLSAIGPGATVTDALDIALREAIIPVLGAQRDAILRLAREVDELRASKGED